VVVTTVVIVVNETALVWVRVKVVGGPTCVTVLVSVKVEEVTNPDPESATAVIPRVPSASATAIRARYPFLKSCLPRV
jgi:hypothetical protein